jgi:UDP:flavonoid glycosyltransferase YjiC (YdhE family)
MRFLVAVQGSYGDVNPCLEIALGLRRRGHQVFFITSEFYAPLLNRHGIDFQATVSREEHLRITSHPDYNHRFKCYKYAASELVFRPMRREYQAIADHYEPGNTAVLVLGMTLGSRIAHDKLGVPLVNLLQFPGWMWSVEEPFGVNGYRPLPMWARKLVRLLMMKRLTSIGVPDANRLRVELGLQPIQNGHMQWIFSPQLVLGLFPEWYSSPKGDWPPNVYLCGFPSPEVADRSELSSEAEEFLQAGDPPLVINSLSAYHGALEFFRVSVEAVRRMNRRAILLSQFAHNIPSGLPPEIRHFSYLPHGALLPRAAGIVHQGGIGTTVKAMRAGIPQVIVPVNFDQPHNALSVQTLGVGDMVPKRQYEPDRLVEVLGALLDSPSVAERCRHYSEKIKAHDGISEACRAIEDVCCHGRPLGPARTTVQRASRKM